MPASWYSVDDLDRVLAAWDNAPIGNSELLASILDTAKGDVIAYADADPDEAKVPDRYVLAQLMQAKALATSLQPTTLAGDIGTEDYSFTPGPRTLDLNIRRVIRPPSGGPFVL